MLSKGDSSTQSSTAKFPDAKPHLPLRQQPLPEPVTGAGMHMLTSDRLHQLNVEQNERSDPHHHPTVYGDDLTVVRSTSAKSEHRTGTASSRSRGSSESDSDYGNAQRDQGPRREGAPHSRHTSPGFAHLTRQGRDGQGPRPSRSHRHWLHRNCVRLGNCFPWRPRKSKVVPAEMRSTPDASSVDSRDHMHENK